MLRSITALVALTISMTFAMPAPAQGQASQQIEPAQHMVVRGNTLWDLADFFYGNPFEWRRIWDANRDRVDNPDLIYPGQVLRIPDEEGNFMEVVVMPGGGAQPRAEQPTASRRTVWYPDPADENVIERAREMVPAVQPDIVYSAPFLVPADPAMGPMIGTVGGFAGAVESRTARESARSNDRLFLDFAGGAPAPGTLLQTYRMTPQVLGDAGVVAEPTGLIRVVSRGGERMVGLVEQVFDRMLPGDMVRTFEIHDPRPGVRAERVAPGSPVEVIGFALPDAEIHGPGDYLFIPRGTRDGVRIGDEYVVRVAGTGDIPEGRFLIVRVDDESATGRIVGLRNPVFDPGVSATLERRMPAR